MIHKQNTKECVAKLKFWFGQGIKDLFNEEKYVLEYIDQFVYVYKK